MKNKQKLWWTIILMGLVFIACDDENNIPTCAHEWGEWEETAPATCTLAVRETRICKFDHSHTQTRIKEGSAPLGHLWGYWEQISGSMEKRTCTRSGCGVTETRTALPATKTFSFSASHPGSSSNNLIATKNITAPTPVSSTIARNVIISNNSITTSSNGYFQLITIIDADGYGWDSADYVALGNGGTLTVSGLTDPLTIYANGGYGWYQASGTFFTPEEQVFGDGSLGKSFTMNKSWIMDWNGKLYKPTSSFTRMYWVGGDTIVNLSNVAQNPEEWLVTISGGNLTMKLGAPKNEYLYSLDVFASRFCDLAGNNLTTNNKDILLLDIVDLSTTVGHTLETDCSGICGSLYGCSAFLIYANEDAAISGSATSHAITRFFDLNLRAGWNIAIWGYNAVYSGPFGNHIKWRILNE